MNWIIILGIVVIGFGTYLIYLGSDLNNQKGQKDVISKIENTQLNIDNLKQSTENDSVLLEIDSIENEFKVWADEFMKNKESKKLNLEKAKVMSSESRITMSEEWLPGYITFFDVIKKSLDAYNARTNSNIEYNFPDIPQNIFINSEDNYSAYIHFREDVVWELSLIAPEKLERNYEPKFRGRTYSADILNEDEVKKMARMKDEFSIIIYGERLGIHTYRNRKLNFEYLKDEYKLTSPGGTLSEIARDLIEAQLIQL